MNLNEDGMLNRKIFFDLSKHTKATAGRKGMLMELGGVGIQPQHCTFETSGNQTFLVPSSEAAVPNIYINGNVMTKCEKVDLKPNTRVILGTGSVFLYRNEIRKQEADIQDEPEITYQYAMDEKRKNDDIQAAAQKEAEKQKLEAETAAKMKALQDKMDAEQAEKQK